MKKNNNIFKFDRQGFLESSTIRAIREDCNKAETIWDNKVFSYIVVTILMFIDFACIFQLFDSILYESFLLKSVSILALLAIFEVIPIYASRTYKRNEQGFRIEKWMLIALLIAFGCAVILNLILRIYYKDISFPDYSQINFAFDGSAATSSNKSSLLLAIFFGTMPFLTSVLSGYISFYSYNPLRENVDKLQYSYDDIQAEINKVDSVLAEYDADPNFLERIANDDEKKFGSKQKMILQLKYELQDDVRERLKEHLKQKEDISYLSYNPKDEEN